MDGVFETQPDRTDLPLVVMPVVIESMIGPFKQNFTMLDNVARVRMYEGFTLDEDTIVERCKDADAVMVIGFHCADAILDRLDAKCYAFGGTGVASYINLEKTKERGIRVCNVLHYGDHAVAEHAMALLMELTRHAGALDMQVKQGDWDGADGFELFGKKLGIIGLGAIGVKVANAAVGLDMEVWGYDPFLSVDGALKLDRSVKHVTDLNEIFANCDYITIHVPLNADTKNTISAEAIEKMKDGVRVINLARGELVDTKAMAKALESGKVAAYVSDFASDEILEQENAITLPHLGASIPERVLSLFRIWAHPPRRARTTARRWPFTRSLSISRRAPSAIRSTSRTSRFRMRAATASASSTRTSRT